ncbi:MAG: hypothetical protein N3B14_03685 [Thermoleophilia bacterium]|nr:hypothetical protein [Thermoleophilia bacterium]
MAFESRVQGSAPIARNVFWVVMSCLAWEIYQVLRASAQAPAGSWALAPADLVLLVLFPALAAFAFTRLFLALNQTSRGTLHIYTTISSPFAWIFWIGLATGMIGHGLHLAGHALHQAMPEVLAMGEFAAKINFVDNTAGYLVLGIGLFLVSLAILVQGIGVGQEMIGPERFLLVLGSLGTYGFTTLYLAIEGQQLILAIVSSVILCGLGLWRVPPSEITRDPIAALIVPGSFLAGAALIVWTIVVGGQPSWP